MKLELYLTKISFLVTAPVRRWQASARQNEECVDEDIAVSLSVSWCSLAGYNLFRFLVTTCLMFKEFDRTY